MRILNQAKKDINEIKNGTKEAIRKTWKVWADFFLPSSPKTKNKGDEESKKMRKGVKMEIGEEERLKKLGRC